MRQAGSDPRLFRFGGLGITLLAPFGTKFGLSPLHDHLSQQQEGHPMNSIIYLVGLVVIVMAILSFIGLA